MKPFLFIFIFLFSLSSLADDYQDIALVPMPETLSQEMSTFLQKQGFVEQRGMRELKSIGINQVYLHQKSAGFLTVKYHVAGDLAINQMQDIEHGKLFHTQIAHKNMAFYFSGISNFYIEKTTQELKHFQFTQTTNVIIQNLNPISSAHAKEECGMVDTILKNETIRTMAKISSETISKALLNCFNGAKSGVEQSIDLGQDFSDFKQGVLNFWNEPTKNIKEFYGAVGGAITGFFNFTMVLGEAMVNPQVGLPKLEQKLGAAGSMFRGMLSAAMIFPPMAALNLACSMISSIGVDAFINAFTGGAASVKLFLTLKRFNKMFNVMGKLKALLDKLNLKSLDQLGLSDETISKLFHKMSSGELDEKKFDTFTKTLDTDSTVARTLATEGLQCSL